MSSTAPTYTASVSQDLLRYMTKYGAGNEGCIETMTASFQPSGQTVTGQNISSAQSANTGFYFQNVNVSQGVGANIVFFSATIPEGTSTITLSFTTTQGNTYQLATINTLPPNANYALIIIIQLIVTVQPIQYVNAQALAQTFVAFASNKCQVQPQPQVNYNGSGFTVLYQYVFSTCTSIGALLLALNENSTTNVIQVTVTMGGNTVVNISINTPGSEYAYFLFTVSLIFSGG